MAYRQSNVTNNDSTSNISLAFSSNVLAGSLLVVAVRLSSGGNATVTSGGRTFTRDASVVSGGGWSLGIYSLPNAAGGATTIAASFSTTSVRMIIHEYTGAATATPAHKANSGEGTSGALISGTVATTVQCLLFCAGATDGDGPGSWSAGTDGAGTNYTFRNSVQTSGNKLASEDIQSIAAGTHNGRWTTTYGSFWACALVAYAEVTEGAPPTDTPIASVR